MRLYILFSHTEKAQCVGDDPVSVKTSVVKSTKNVTRVTSNTFTLNNYLTSLCVMRVINSQKDPCISKAIYENNEMLFVITLFIFVTCSKMICLM